MDGTILIKVLCLFVTLHCSVTALSLAKPKHNNGFGVGRRRVAPSTQDSDEKYPWSFTGRLWFRPAVVRAPEISEARVLSTFGWTLGGVAALEYDESPVGPYREYVSMGALVARRGAMGTWGKRLYVSCSEAERMCRDLWGVPAEQADIQFQENGPSLLVKAPPCTENNTAFQQIVVEGWFNTRISSNEMALDKKGGIPVLWTPTIKTLWTPFVPFPPINDSTKLPLYRLRLSARSMRLVFCGQQSSESLGIPIGVGLVIDNVLIEISWQIGEL